MIQIKDLKDLFVPYELAIILKEKGFNEPCFGYYDVSPILINGYKLVYVEHEINNPCKNNPNSTNITAPLYQQAFDFLFKKLDFYYPYLKVEIFSDGSGSWYQPADDGNDKLEIDFDTLNEGIQEALKLLKD